MSYHEPLGQVPLPSIATEQLRRQAESIVPSDCLTIDALARLSAWEAPPTSISGPGGAVWALRLPSATSPSVGSAVADAAWRKFRHNLDTAGVFSKVQLNSRFFGYIEKERIAWVAVTVRPGDSVSQRTLNAAASGAFQGATGEHGISTSVTGAAPMIYLSPGRMEGIDLDMRRQVFVASALRSVLTWEQFRAVVAVGVFGQASLTANIGSRTHTSFGKVQRGLGIAQNADQTAAAAEQMGQEAIALAETYATTGAPDDGPCPGNPQQTCRGIGPRAQARRRLETARARIRGAIAELQAAEVAANGLEAEIVAVQSTLRQRVMRAIDATTSRLTETNELRRRYMECALWKNADAQLRSIAVRLQAERAQAPALIAAFRVAKAQAIQRLQEAQQRVEESAQEAERRAGGHLGPILSPLAWGAIAVGAAVFIGGAFVLRAGRKKK